MVMDTIQVRLPRQTVKTIDEWVEKGIYPSRSEAIRAMVRKDVLKGMRGMIPDNGKDSVQEVREVRRKLSQEEMSSDELNSF